jgi:hypothetical protein
MRKRTRYEMDMHEIKNIRKIEETPRRETVSSPDLQECLMMMRGIKTAISTLDIKLMTGRENVFKAKAVSNRMMIAK